MIGIRVAVQTRGLAQSFKKALHIAAGLECDGVQIDARYELRPAELSETGLRQLRKILADLNLRVGSVIFPTRRGYANLDGMEQRLEATRAAMQLASRLQTRILVLDLGIVPQNESSAEYDALVESVTILANHGHRLGVRLAAQVSMRDLASLVDFVASLPEGTLGLDLHPARLIASQQSPAEFITTVGRFISHFHAVDGVYDVASGRGVEVELGRGSADVPELLGLLEEFGYRDWVTIERNNSRQPAEDIGNAVKFLRSL